MGNKFKKPEAPFLLLTEDIDGTVSYNWWDNENDMIQDAVERRRNGERIVYAIEISSCRDVNFPEKYTVDDFIREIDETYMNARDFNIVIIINTDLGYTYRINCAEDDFRCDEYDDSFEYLTDIAEQLYNEKMIGKPVEIRIE